MAQQGERAVADQMRRRLVAGVPEQDRVGVRLALAEPLALLLGGGHRGEQARFPAGATPIGPAPAGAGDRRSTRLLCESPGF
jgi:hypothetical protein